MGSVAYIADFLEERKKRKVEKKVGENYSEEELRREYRECFEMLYDGRTFLRNLQEKLH